MKVPRKPKTKPLATLPMKARSSKSRKLSLEQQMVACQKLATGLKPRVVATQMRKEFGVEATSEAYASYQKTHAAEIAQYRKAWNAGVLDKVHLRFAGSRVIELVHAYGLLVRQFFRVMCPTCAGDGTKLGRKKGAVKKRCETCKGHKWVVPKEADAYDLGDDAAAGALRLANAVRPPSIDPAAWDQMAAILRQIREEVGDAKPEKGGSAEDLEAVARIAALQSMKTKLDKMTSAEFSAFCRSSLGPQRELPGTMTVVED